MKLWKVTWHPTPDLGTQSFRLILGCKGQNEAFIS